MGRAFEQPNGIVQTVMTMIVLALFHTRAPRKKTLAAEQADTLPVVTNDEAKTEND